MAADPTKVYRLKTDGEAVLISDADTLDAFLSGVVGMALNNFWKA